MDLNIKTNNIVFIDATVFLEDGFLPFIKDIILKSNNSTTIYVDKTIEQTIDNYKKTNQMREAYTIEGFIDIFHSMNCLQSVDAKGFFDLSEMNTLIKNNQYAFVLFLTQKESVFQTLAELKKEYPFVELAKFQNNGLSQWIIQDRNVESDDAFYIEKDIYINRVNIEPIDYVYSPKYGHLKLDKSKALKGGEGVLYKTYNNLLCKLYNDEHQTYVNFKKLQTMLTLDIYNPFINWPKDILYYKNDFVGYVMDEIKGAEPLEMLRFTRFNGLSTFDRLNLSYELLQKFQYLHQKNILIGDLKPDNILVKSPKEVYLVDCGCYQINDYSCDVCHLEYTKKSYTSDELKKKLRPFEEEYYPINKILFEILIGKNPHYSRNSGEIDIENKTDFFFPLDVSSISNQSFEELQRWKGVLTDRMREYFYYYFKEGKITYLSEWIHELEVYINNIMTRRKEES